MLRKLGFASGDTPTASDGIVTSFYKRTGLRFPDAIAKGSYRVDIHEGAGNVFRYLDGREQRMEKGPDGEMHWVEGRWREPSADAPTWYEIPFRSIVPKGSVNVLAPGRALDCERDGYGACRVMVNCNQMGEAAGRAAALAVSRGIPVSELLDKKNFGDSRACYH